MIEVSARASPTEFNAAFDRWLLHAHPGGPAASVRWKLSPEHPAAEMREAVRVQNDHLTTAIESVRKSIDDIRARQAMHEFIGSDRSLTERRAVLACVACVAIALVLGAIFVATH